MQKVEISSYLRTYSCASVLQEELRWSRLKTKREVVQQKSDCESTISTSTVAQVKASDSQKKHGENNKKDSRAQWINGT